MDIRRSSNPTHASKQQLLQLLGHFNRRRVTPEVLSEDYSSYGPRNRMAASRCHSALYSDIFLSQSMPVMFGAETLPAQPRFSSPSLFSLCLVFNSRFLNLTTTTKASHSNSGSHYSALRACEQYNGQDAPSRFLVAYPPVARRPSAHKPEQLHLSASS